MKKYQVQIISCLYCDLEAEALTKTLEMFDCDVIKSRVGCADDFISLVNGTNIYENTNLIIICAHGDDDLGVNSLIASSMPSAPNNYETIDFSSKELCGELPNIPVICLGCWTSREDFVKVFLQNGCNPYIAPKDVIDSRDAMLFMTLLLYQHFVKDLSIKKSFQLANNSIQGFLFFEKEKLV